MASWFLVPCLVQLRNEFNALNPKRDKGADGSIGDTTHQAEPTSDHNPDLQGRVKALDIDSSGPWPGFTFAAAVQVVIDRCRSGREDRIEYVIWDRHIYSRSYSFSKRVYTGTADPHTNHAHFSARHDHHGESDTRGWNLLTLEDDMSVADVRTGLAQMFAEAAAATNTDAKDDTPDGRNFRRSLDALLDFGSTAGPLADQVKALTAQVADLKAQVAAQQTATLSEAQVKAIGDAIGNAANGALQDVVNKLERAGSALTQ